MADAINGAFETLGGLLILLNVRRVLRDRSTRGVSIVPTAFFCLWGLWNLYYYPSLDQWVSFAGGVAVVAANSVWVCLATYYKLKVKHD